ncbi:5'-nucleotidase [Flavobacteriaceae bacterium UJ101]|nr:5'-nucleotidase [Flavobacteriaceae bacterium UJ101]
MRIFKLIIVFFTITLLMIQCSEDESIIRDITTNLPPTASSLNISGAPVVGQILKGNYTYTDKEGDQENGSEYKWYRADNNTGLNRIEIPNATDTVYTVTDADVSKFLSFEVTPKQIDSQKGETMLSNYVGQVNDNSSISQSMITVYQVNNGEITDPFNYNVIGELYEAQQDIAKHNEIWDLVKKSVPDSYINRIAEFKIFWGVTDGRKLGYVEANSDLTVWNFAMAIDYAYPDGVFDEAGTLETTLHEFAHILTLNDTQVDEEISVGNCDNYFPDYPKEGFARYGCSFTDSYINQYYVPFWENIWNAAQNNGLINSEVEYFSNTYPEEFITSYAGTTPSEDLAETYIAYILNQNSLKPIVQQKIDFFKTLPEFEQIKTETRDKLGSLAGRVSSKVSTNHRSTGAIRHGCVRIR